MRKPEEESVRSIIFDWRDAIHEKEKIDQKFLKELLIAFVEGMLILDERISSLSSQEWRGAKEIISLQDELNMQRYKMISISESIKKLSLI